jgi:type I restriction enzyme S subunit
MKLPRYENYCDTNNLWTRSLPEGWRVTTLRRIASRYSGGTPDKSNQEYWTDGDIPWINSGAVNQINITEPSAYITLDAYNNSSAKWVPEGALVIALAGQGKTKGMVAQTNIRTTCNQSMAAIIPSHDIYARFLFWWLGANYKHIRNMAGGDLRDGLNLDMLGDIPCPLPPKNEQINISRFLDAETFKIDNLIAEQESLIELLKEKRQAAISHVVTKGLNPEAQMKGSGIEWLGTTPNDWILTPLRHLISTRKGIAFKADDFSDDGIYVVKASDIKNRTIRQPNTFLPPNFADLFPQAILSDGEIILSTVGSVPEVKNSAVGQVGRVPHELEGSLLNQNTVIFSACDTLLISDYLFYVIQMQAYRDHLDLNAHGTANQASLNIRDMLDFLIPLPPVSAQRAIADKLYSFDLNNEQLMCEAEIAVSLLQERRCALISAAVTGKIDVRNYSPEEAAAA